MDRKSPFLIENTHDVFFSHFLLKIVHHLGCTVFFSKHLSARAIYPRPHLPKQRLHFSALLRDTGIQWLTSLPLACKEHLIWVDAGDFLFFADPALLLREHLKKLKGQVVATYPEVGSVGPQVFVLFPVVTRSNQRFPFQISRPLKEKQHLSVTTVDWVKKVISSW